jgi:WD repeat-containing protein 26
MEMIKILNAKEKEEENIKYLINEQIYLELLEKKEINEGLKLLRNELIFKNIDNNRIHVLVSLIGCKTTQELYKRSNWDGRYFFLYKKKFKKKKR